MCTPDKKHPWLTFSDKLPQNQPSWTFSPNSYNRTYGRRMYRPPKKRRSWSHKNQVFLKSHDFCQNFFWFLTFSPKWITFDTCSPWLTPKNKGGLLWLTFDKNQSKKIFLKKIVEKIFIVRFQQIFSPELKALARFCKNQLRHQWIANDRPLWTRVSNFNFFYNYCKKISK